jgi:hypothetical protein
VGRIRTIKPEFPQSESMGSVSRESRLCFILLWTQADDEGRLRGSSRMLASLLFPYDADAPTLIDGWLSELEREKCISRYEVESRHYIEITNWLVEQKIDHPSRSKLPGFARIREDSSNGRESSRGIKDQGPRKGSRIKELKTPSAEDDLTPAEVAITNGKLNLDAPEPEPEKPSRAKKREGQKTKTEKVESRHAEFKAAIEAYWKFKNPGVEMPWDGAEGKALGMWLAASPNTTIDQFKEFLRNRAKSDVTPSDRPSKWIRDITSFAAGPLDRYGKLLAQGKQPEKLDIPRKPVERAVN